MSVLLTKIAKKIRTYETANVANVIKIGGLLKDAKELVNHGDFLAWLSREFTWSYRTACRYRAAYDLAQSSTWHI